MTHAFFQPLTIERRQMEAAAMLRCGIREDREFDRLSAIFDVDWPRVTNSAVDAGAFRILCLSSVEWLVEGIDGATLASKLMPVLSDLHHVTDESGAWICFRLQGTPARDLLAKGCSIDLDHREFLPGQCVQTRLAQIYAIIHRGEESDAFDVYVEAPLAAYFSDWLAHSSMEFENEIGDNLTAHRSAGTGGVS